MDVTYFNLLMAGIGLIAVVLAVAGLLLGLIYCGFRLSSRLSNLEKSQEAFQSNIADLLKKASPSTDSGGHNER